MLRGFLRSLAAAIIALPAAAQAPAGWTAPRTPWGEPDLQGWFTNVNLNGVPFERPDQFAGRRLEDITDAELTKLRQDAQKRILSNFEGPIHGPDHWWQDDLNLVEGKQAWMVVDPPDGKIPPLTPQAQERNRQRAAARRASGRGPADGPEDRSLYDRCITRGMPGSMMPVIYGNSYQIVQAPGVVAIRYEMVHETRVIQIGPKPHLGNAIRSYMGDPRGYWDGDTLVIETTNFKEGTAYRNANASTVKIIERFRRTAPDKVRWAVTVDDPETWTRNWTFAMDLTMDDSMPVLEYACHEGNYGLRNILTAARAEEAAAAAKKEE
jgi:hypothetical protein